MRRVALAAVFVCGCTLNSEPAPLAAAPVTTGTEVLIVSVPAGAKILLGDAELGATPMTIKITAQTTLVLELSGFTRQAVTLAPESRPNLVVNLVPTAPTAVASAEPHASKAQRSPSRESKASTAPPPTPKGQLASTPPPGPATSPSASPAPQAAPGKAPRTFDTMRQVKDALRKGDIDRQGYKDAQTEIRRRIREETEALKKQYRDGKITQREYETQVRAVKIKYEG